MADETQKTLIDVTALKYFYKSLQNVTVLIAPSTVEAASSSNVGHVYLIPADGTYAGIECKMGDHIVSNGTTWVLIPKSTEGTIAKDISYDNTTSGISATNVQNAIEETYIPAYTKAEFNLIKDNIKVGQKFIITDDESQGGGESSGASSADEVSYDNTTSEIDADNLQGAIDVLDERLDAIEANPTSNMFYKIKKLETAISPNFSSYKFYVSTDGITFVEDAESDVINIPKDMVVDSGSVKECTVVNNPVSGYQVGDKYIDLVLANSDRHIYVLVSDLVSNDANGIVFDNSGTDLSSTNVQNAIEEIAATIGDINSVLEAIL